MDKQLTPARPKPVVSDEIAARMLMVKLKTDSKDKPSSPASWTRTQPSQSHDLNWTANHSTSIEVSLSTFCSKK